MKTLTVYANDEVAYEYDRDTVLEEQQLSYFDKMDADMDRGIKMKGEHFAHPDTRQKATFVAMNLIRALQQDNQPIIFASCAYLAFRLPTLVEVRAYDQGSVVNVDLVEEH